MNQRVVLFTSLSLAARFVDAHATQAEVDASQPGLFLYAIDGDADRDVLNATMQQIASNETPDPYVARLVCGLRAHGGDEAMSPESLTFYDPDGNALVVLNEQQQESDQDINALMDKAWEGLTNVPDFSARLQSIFSGSIQPFAMANAMAHTLMDRNALFAAAFQAMNEGNPGVGEGRMFGVQSDGGIREITSEVADAIAESRADDASAEAATQH